MKEELAPAGWLSGKKEMVALQGIKGTLCVKATEQKLAELGIKLPDQLAKRDAGKLQLTMVPRNIIRRIASVRMYGNQKYGDPENWRTVEIQRYRDAAFRHFLAYLDDPTGVDVESGLPHLDHLACNIAFLSELEAVKSEQSG